MDEQYLSSFIREGGAAIKFAVPSDGKHAHAAMGGLRAVGQRLGYLVVDVDAEITKVHQVEQLFFAIARQVPWRELSTTFLQQLAAEKGYERVDEGMTSLADRLAKGNGVNKAVILMELRLQLVERVFKNRDIAKHMRIALLHLCLAALSGGPEGETTMRLLTDWLTGQNRAISAVKHYQIYAGIARHNARHLFESLLVWLRLANVTGLLVLLDLKRVGLSRNPHDERLFYTKAALLDSYELLRQFIDSTDRLKACCFVVRTQENFLNDDNDRGVSIYGALKNRVYDEVRDRRRVNPMASLVRLA
jgi:hypothetical protein